LAYGHYYGQPPMPNASNETPAPPGEGLEGQQQTGDHASNDQQPTWGAPVATVNGVQFDINGQRIPGFNPIPSPLMQGGGPGNAPGSGKKKKKKKQQQQQLWQQQQQQQGIQPLMQMNSHEMPPLPPTAAPPLPPG